MAKPPRQSGRRATFTPEAAQRIARAVLVVEKGDRSIEAAGRQLAAGDDSLVRGTFSAPWDKGSTKTVTDATLTAVKYEGVKNYFATVAGSGSKKCAIAYVAGEWILIAAECG
jgi:hypothetical protein